ncbi:GRASP55/65 PDZ-like domain-containing protein [Xylariaceae sp. FL0255]|nr:GRASP55/65 PDZ-like domain-containing protein [Xylariaceae sp. FL0255]
MFNALNRYLSRLDGDSRQQQKEGQGWGFQVLRNANLELAIEPWFDFIVGINGRMIDNPDPGLFAQEIRNCAGGTVSLGLWSAKGQRTRVLHLPVPAQTGTLGLSLQWASLNTASTIWHVLDVPSNSPADVAGLLPYSDYILGTPDATLYGESGLGELVDDYIGRPLKLWVYNNEYNVTREVEIVPSRDWGGEGALGCVLGFGALHRLPPPLDEPVDAPGETMFDGGDAAPGYGQGYDNGTTTEGQFQTFAPPPPSVGFVEGGAPPGDNTAGGGETGSGGEFMIPSQMVSPPPPTAGTAAAPSRGKKKGRGTAPNRLMDDYFAEEEKKSKALDGNISASKTPPPPPPKASGGPPPAAGGPAAAESPQEGDGDVD